MLFHGQLCDKAVVVLRAVAEHLSHLSEVRIHSSTSDQHLPTRAHPVNPSKRAERGRLAGPIHPKQGKALSRSHRERSPLHNQGRPSCHTRVYLPKSHDLNWDRLIIVSLQGLRLFKSDIIILSL